MAMTQDKTLTRANFKTPKAAAIAGILFCILLLTVFWLLRISVPTDPLEPGEWLRTSASRVALALNLIPFAGLAFLWFIGVLRDRLGNREDRFFATVFLGSGLLFLAMLFAAAAVVGGILATFALDHDAFVELNDVPFRPLRRIQYHQYLCSENSRRIFDLDIDAGNLHWSSATLDGVGWLCIGGFLVVWKLLRQLGFRAFSIVGTFAQHLYSA